MFTNEVQVKTLGGMRNLIMKAVGEVISETWFACEFPGCYPDMLLHEETKCEFKSPIGCLVKRNECQGSNTMQ